MSNFEKQFAAMAEKIWQRRTKSVPYVKQSKLTQWTDDDHEQSRKMETDFSVLLKSASPTITTREINAIECAIRAGVRPQAIGALSESQWKAFAGTKTAKLMDARMGELFPRLQPSWWRDVS